jgi:lysophospholipase L1-like esterase
VSPAISRRRWLAGFAIAAAFLPALGLALSGPAHAAGRPRLAHVARPARYVALGDSYSSGLGAGSYAASSGPCFRSRGAYSQLWASASKPASYISAACAGATTSSVIATQLSALSSATTLVSITIGGNDVGFSAVMETCVLSSTSECVSAVATARSEMSSKLPAELDGVLAAIAALAPHARVVLLGYPRLYDMSRSSGCIGLSATDRTDLNAAANDLNRQLQVAAARHHDVFADVRPTFAGHLICDSASWLHSVEFPDIAESYHPTAAGQAGGYLPAFSAAAGP